MLKEGLGQFIKGINKKSWMLILLGSLSWSLTMVKSGLVYDFGMGFWGPNGHDGVWHISIAQGLANGSWEMPIFAGELIKNYHIGFDLVLAVLHKLTTIPIVNLYFQFLPPILSALLGVSVYKFVVGWKNSKPAAFWSVFFVYFGGSFGWIMTLFRSGGFGGESVFWSQQSISTLINPPFALSLIMLFLGLDQLRSGLKTGNKRNLLIASILFGCLVQIKVYAAILILGALLVAGLYNATKRKGFEVFKVFSGSLVLSLLLLLPMIDVSRSTLVFAPFWFLEGMMAFPDRFYWPKFAEAMVNYRLGGVWLKGVVAYTVALFIFWYGNLGTRFIFQLPLTKKLKKRKGFDLLEGILLLMLAAGVVIPMLYVQKGTPWNTIQFFYYSLVFSGVLAGVGLGRWLTTQTSTVLRSAVVIVVVLFTVPTTVSTLWLHYLPSRPPAMISNGELEALRFLKSQPDGVVLTIPFDREAANAAIGNPPRPLYLYESTAYVSAFSGKPVYMEDEVNLEITGYEWRDRRGDILGALENQKIREFVADNVVTYVYLTKPSIYQASFDMMGMEKVFENGETSIYLAKQ